MPQLRQDPTTKEWVVIATERARRPDQFGKRDRRTDAGTEAGVCVLCPGNEGLTPPEVASVRADGWPDQPGWRVRVIPNKFPAFVPIAGSVHRRKGPLFNTRSQRDEWKISL